MQASTWSAPPTLAAACVAAGALAAAPADRLPAAVTAADGEESLPRTGASHRPWGRRHPLLHFLVRPRAPLSPRRPRRGPHLLPVADTGAHAPAPSHPAAQAPRQRRGWQSTSVADARLKGQRERRRRFRQPSAPPSVWLYFVQ
ncbi:hypothetical protein I4F81_003144 [Pyropia yezoensis]|uniref:Uncharacterized protein n=1 Tax=Pyropia yezoensis TaxID=2788 RepID=A0ACC3BSX6_PYRYE|nr:hypothetical protein I4F81_003144 [Neopyropia yezoensis]